MNTHRMNSKTSIELIGLNFQHPTRVVSSLNQRWVDDYKIRSPRRISSCCVQIFRQASLFSFDHIRRRSIDNEYRCSWYIVERLSSPQAPSTRTANRCVNPNLLAAGNVESHGFLLCHVVVRHQSWRKGRWQLSVSSQV